jgi:hypothetical protein
MVGLAHIPSPSRQREGNRHKPSCMLMSLKCGEQNMGDTGGESHMEVFQHEAKHFSPWSRSLHCLKAKAILETRIST